MSTLLPHLNDNTASTLSQATLRLSIPKKYRNDAQSGIKSALLDILERHCEACYESLEDSYNALVRTGLGSDDTFASDMATYLGITEEEVTLHPHSPTFVKACETTWHTPKTQLKTTYTSTCQLLKMMKANRKRVA